MLGFGELYAMETKRDIYILWFYVIFQRLIILSQEMLLIINMKGFRNIHWLIFMGSFYSKKDRKLNKSLVLLREEVKMINIQTIL